MNELQRHRWTFKVLMPFVEVFLKWKFNYEYDDIGEIEGPYLLLANHNLELDPAVVGRAVGHQIYFVASEHILRKGIGTWLLMTFFKPIIHMKGKQGVTTVKQMLKTLRDGHSVCIFPEGNRSFNGLTGDMQTAIGRVAKKAKAKIITYRVEGGYFTQPRWSVSLRKGKMRGRLIHVYAPEELETMNDEQIHEAIVKDLYEDAYETQKKEKIAFCGKDLALGLESTVFLCPSCGKIGTLASKHDHLFCDCGFDAVYDVYGMLTEKNGNQYTVTQLDDLQKKRLEEMLKNESGNLFGDDVIVHYINEKHVLEKKETCRLHGNCEGITYGTKKILFSEIEGMAIYSRNSLVIHEKSVAGHIEIKSEDIGFNALKYMYLYQLQKKKA